jgi:hypothetical protein
MACIKSCIFEVITPKLLFSDAYLGMPLCLYSKKGKIKWVSQNWRGRLKNFYAQDKIIKKRKKNRKLQV